MSNALTILLVMTMRATAPSPQDDRDYARDVLRAAQSERLAWITGRIEWSGWTARKGLTWSEVRYHSTQFTAGEQLITDRGDSEGVLIRRDDGSPHPLSGSEPYFWLFDGTRQWERRSNSIRAEVQLSEPFMVDIRSIGFGTDVPRDVSNRPGFGILPRDDDLSAVVRPDGLIEVSRWGQSRGSRIKWTIDPERNWNPVDVTYEVGKEIRQNCRVELAEFDGGWFVRRCEYFDAEYAGGKEPLYVMEVSAAEFNRPDHPRRFTPADIGVEEGMQVDAYADTQARYEERVTKLGWHQNNLIGRDELREGLRTGLIKPSPTLERNVDRALANGIPQSYIENAWRSYTHQFIVGYDLDKDQSQKAMSILRDCEERAAAHFAAHKPEYDEIAMSLSKIDEDQSISTTEKSEKLERLRNRRIELDGKIREIARTRLYPGLDKLPTRAQRKAAERLEALTGKKLTEPESEKP